MSLKQCFKILWVNNRAGKKNNPSDWYSLMNSNSLSQKAEENHGNNVLPIICASRVALVKSETNWRVEKNIVLCFVYLTLVGFIQQRCVKSIWNRYTENKVASDKRQRMPTNLPWLETILLGIFPLFLLSTKAGHSSEKTFRAPWMVDNKVVTIPREGIRRRLPGAWICAIT